MTLSETDLDHCRSAIRTGSYSFHAASRLLPSAVRDPALVLYAFCRLADDAVDETDAKAGAVMRLRDRLDQAYAGRPRNAPEDRAFAAVVEAFEMPIALPEALLEGLAWDAQGRRHRTLSDVRAYSAGVAAAVGAMMCVLMRVRDRHALARACDLGVAMQLTNIARDVGEDARAGRLYLPTGWLDEAGTSAERFLREPLPTPEICRIVNRILLEADRLYRRAEAGIAALPPSMRPGIWAARLIYDGIGGAVRGSGCDSISHRARTSAIQKAGWLVESGTRAAASLVMPRSAVLFAPPLDETRWLVEAAARPDPSPGRAAAMLAVLADLARREEGLGHRGRPA